MPVAVTLVDAGGFPITEVSYGLPMTPVASGGYPVTVVVSGGIPVTLVTDTLAPYEDPETEVALTLTWTSGTGTLTPTFTLSGAILADDSITLSIYSDAGLTTLVDSDVNVVDPAEVIAGTLDFPGIGALSDGTYWAVATLSGTGRSGTSNTETKTLAAFDPLDLFGGGEKGIYIDASDISTLWQDTGATSAITADGQTVKRVNDLSGNSNNVTEATNGPLYKTDGSKHWLLFDGSNDVLAKASSNIGASVTAITIFIAWEYTTPGSDKYVISQLDGSFIDRFALLAHASAGPFGRASRVQGVGANTLFDGTDRGGAARVTVLEIDYTNGDGFIYNGSSLSNSNTAITSNGTTSATADTFQIGDPSFGAAFKLYKLLIINRLLTAGEKTSLGANFATASGGTY
jgi:hypothetical protein